MHKRFSSIALLVLLGIVPLFTHGQNKKYAIRKVVIDAGHGGHDGGCHGKKSKEKDVALAVALKLGRLLEENMPDVKVIYTRKTDVFVELHERAAIANNNKADVFICIHCNSGPKSACGTETFVLGLHKSESNLKVAQRENASILMEDDYQAKYEGFDPNSPEAYIIFSLYQNAFIDQSLGLAAKVQSQFTAMENRPDRGVKQAGFLVLWRTTMPAILVETGFLTNPEEEKYMSSEEGQSKIARSLFNAFSQYKAEIEKGSVPVHNGAPHTPHDHEKPEKKAKDTIETKGVYIPDTSGSVVQEKPIDTPRPEVKSEDVASSVENIVFRVQILTSPASKPLKPGAPAFKGVTPIFPDQAAENVIKYMAGSFPDFEKANTFQTELRNKGFKDAFVVAYRDGKRVPVQEARALLKNKVN